MSLLLLHSNGHLAVGGPRRMAASANPVVVFLFKQRSERNIKFQLYVPPKRTLLHFSTHCSES